MTEREPDFHFVLQFMDDEETLYELDLDHFQVGLKDAPSPMDARISIALSGAQYNDIRNLPALAERILPPAAPPGDAKDDAVVLHNVRYLVNVAHRERATFTYAEMAAVLRCLDRAAPPTGDVMERAQRYRETCWLKGQQAATGDDGVSSMERIHAYGKFLADGLDALLQHERDAAHKAAVEACIGALEKYKQGIIDNVDFPGADDEYLNVLDSAIEIYVRPLAQPAQSPSPQTKEPE